MKITRKPNIDHQNSSKHHGKYETRFDRRGQENHRWLVAGYQVATQEEKLMIVDFQNKTGTHIIEINNYGDSDWMICLSH